MIFIGEEQVNLFEDDVSHISSGSPRSNCESTPGLTRASSIPFLDENMNLDDDILAFLAHERSLPKV
jgi:hypothetical protein